MSRFQSQFPGDEHPLAGAWKRLDVSQEPLSFRVLKFIPPQNGTDGLKFDWQLGSLVEENPHCLVAQDVAVSYTWGSEPFDHYIDVSGLLVPVTRSCYDVLRRRFTNSDGTGTESTSDAAWIDQLCIDQLNSSEKGQQVQMMGTVYEKAKRVYAWLGHRRPALVGQNEIDPGWTLMRRLAQEHYQTPTTLPPQTFADNDNAWTSLKHMLTRPYFSRRWIMQEVLVNKNTFVLFKDTTEHFEVLNSCYLYLFLFWDKVHDPGRHLRSGRVSTDKCPFQPVGLFLAYAHLFIDKQSKRSFDFLSLMLITANLKTSVPVDAIFSLLHLPSDRDLLPAPDYESHCSVVLRRFAISVVNQGYATDVLLQAGLGARALRLPETYLESVQELSAWCPSWIEDEYFLWFPQFLRRSGPVMVPNSLLAADARFLSLDISYVANVSISASFEGAFDEFRKDISVDPTRTSSHLLNEASPSETDGTRHSSQPHHLNRKVTQTWVEALGRRSLDSTTQLQPLILFDRRTHCFATTKDGRLGVAPIITVTGDKLVLFRGSRLPSVVREVDEGIDQRYVLLKPAFFRGVHPVPGFPAPDVATAREITLIR